MENDKRAPFELTQPFTADEVTGLADSVRGRRRAALLAYAATLRQQAERGDGAVSDADIHRLLRSQKPFGELHPSDYERMREAVAPLLRAPAEQGGRVDEGTFGALKDLYRAYVRLLEAGRDRICDLGGECDPVNVMEQSDPYLIQARRAIEQAALAQNAQGDEFAAAAYAATGRGPLSDDEIEVEKNRVVTHAERARVPDGLSSTATRPLYEKALQQALSEWMQDEWRQGDTGWMIDRAKELVAQWSAATSKPEDAA